MICRKCNAEIPDGSVFCNMCGIRQELPKRTPKKRGNGTGTVYKLKSGMYQAAVTVAVWHDHDGKLHQKRIYRNFVKRSDAILALAEMKASCGYVPPTDMTLHDLWDIYEHSRDYDALSGSQRDKLSYAWKRWEPLEFRGIRTLTVSDIEDTIEKQVSTFYPARDMKVCLSHLYDIAVKREIVPSRKTDFVEIPYEQPKAKREVWTSEEVDALWKDYQTHPFTAYILIMCYAGLRYGELSTIPLENIDLDQDKMTWGIKSEAGIDREIPIHPRIKPLIESIIPKRKRKLLEMNDDNFYAAYWETIDRAGLRRLPPHTCRHFFFSRMTSAGIQGGIIAEVGGHASYMTTLKNYVRIPFSDKLEAVKTI